MGILKYKNYFPGAYYHIYNRGNNKQRIFLENKDYLLYLWKLRRAIKKNNIDVICYCLMPNHIHLLVKQLSKIPVYKFVSSLHTAYSMYFNKRYKKVGHLFQDRFKQKIIQKSEYLLYLSCYIHLNPQIDRIVKKAEKYPWSSYPDYAGLRWGTLCDKTMIKKLVPCGKGQSFNDVYKKFVENNKNFIFTRAEIKDQLKDCP